MVDLFSNSILPLFQFITPCCNHFGKFSYASCNLPNISLAFDRAQGGVGGEKSGPTDLKCRLDPAVLVPPSLFNAIKNYAHCNERLATFTNDVNVCFVALHEKIINKQNFEGTSLLLIA